MRVAIQTSLTLTVGNDTAFFYEGDYVTIDRTTGDPITGKIHEIHRDRVCLLSGRGKPVERTVYARNIKSVQRSEDGAHE